MKRRFPVRVDLLVDGDVIVQAEHVGAGLVIVDRATPDPTLTDVMDALSQWFGSQAELEDAAGVVLRHITPAKPCGCITDERTAPPLCTAASGEEHETFYCALPLGHARTHQFNRRY